MNFPVRFLALFQVRNVKKFERMNSLGLWKETKDYVHSKKNSVNKLGLRFHAFGSLSEKWLKNSLPENLHQLWIQSCRLEKESISVIPSELQQLVIKDCKTLKDSHLGQLPPSLKTLVLFKCPNITDQGIKAIHDSEVRSSLTHLDLTCNVRITNDVFQWLPPKLELLELSSCKLLTVAGIEQHGLPSHLKSLSVNCIDMSNRVLDLLPPSLTYLDLVHTSVKMNANFASLMPKNMQELRLCSCNSFTQMNAGFVPQNLTRMSLMHCRGLWPSLMDSIPKNLTVLSLYGSAVDDVINNIPASLTELDLSASRTLTDKGLEGLKYCDQLKTLRLDETKITSFGLRLHLPRKLRDLSISRCELVDDKGLEHLPPTLSRFSALECPLLTSKAVFDLQRERINLIIMSSYSITRDILRRKFSDENAK
eukprot:TRINITY_DN2808_c0_g1_i2.p1 TRINITY_DN2808_c0_g1~~TRINITY_DN2808_c0_g1_i2.p1  ORF type:complete len:423 (-),score=115.22 TRINITY_DN2808_c0_g1_i2:56-1324(-)